MYIGQILCHSHKLTSKSFIALCALIPNPPKTIPESPLTMVGERLPLETGWYPVSVATLCMRCKACFICTKRPLRFCLAEWHSGWRKHVWKKANTEDSFDPEVEVSTPEIFTTSKPEPLWFFKLKSKIFYRRCILKLKTSKTNQVRAKMTLETQKLVKLLKCTK